MSLERVVRSPSRPTPRAPRAAKQGGGLKIAGIGRIYVWNGGSLWIGRSAGRGQFHKHHAIQITFASDQPILLRTAPDAEWSEYCGAVVRNDQPHQFDGCGESVAQLFVEPETAAGRALMASRGDAAITPLESARVEEIARPLFACFRMSKAETSMIEAAQLAVDRLAASAPAAVAIDARITRVLDALRAKLDHTPTLAATAALIHLSPSRFRHLFVERTGTSFRSYVLWLRLNVAIESFNRGHNWTRAAHRAGFADSAHLSRTFRRMFGITPIMLVKE